MPPAKKESKEEFVKEIFLTLAPRWDVKDKWSAMNLTRYAYEMVDGFQEVVKEREKTTVPKPKPIEATKK